MVRRLKDRLNLKKLTCIATSATLGKEGDPESTKKVRKFAAELFNDDFSEQNPIYGKLDLPKLNTPGYQPTPQQYISASDILKKDVKTDISKILGMDLENKELISLLGHDKNLFKLRIEILVDKPKLLKSVAEALWPNDIRASDGLQALMEIVAIAKSDDSHEDLLPTRLHYFVKSQDGLHICLHKQCPGRNNGGPAFFVSRKNKKDVPEGFCPDCFPNESKLVEVVTCRKCGYLFGALQDVGPHRDDDNESDKRPLFDSFSTELGWASDSFWSYFSVDKDLPYPDQVETDEIEEKDKDNWLFTVSCG